MIDKGKLEQDIIAELKTCYDPEIPVDIYELGLIYELRVDNSGNVYVKMTLTSPNCPVAESLPNDVKKKIKKVKGVNEMYLDLVFEPPWSMDKMSEEAKLVLGFL